MPGTFIPWVGAGIGYEELKIKASSGGLSQSATVSGFELLNLQGGGEFLTSSDFSVGPFVSLSFGQYRSASFGNCQRRYRGQGRSTSGSRSASAASSASEDGHAIPVHARAGQPASRIFSRRLRSL